MEKTKKPKNFITKNTAKKLQCFFVILLKLLEFVSNSYLEYPIFKTWVCIIIAIFYF